MEKVAKNKPLISVIVPVYNVEKYLDRCVNSIINQTYTNIEVLLVDDGSKDKSPKMCDDWSKKDKRIKTIHKENGGVSSARNVALDNAKGEYITCVDSDDWLEENFLDEMYNTLIGNKADYITCGYNRTYEDGHSELFNDDGSITIVGPEVYADRVLEVQPGYGFTHMKLVRRDTIGDIRFNESLKVGEDALFNIELCNKVKRIVLLNKPLYNYYFNPDSLVRKYDSNYVNKYYTSMEAMYNYINSTSKNKKIYKYIAFHVLLVCVNYCYHPENKNPKESLKEVCNMPLFKEAIKKADTKNWAKKRKITLFTLKFKLYSLTAIICKMRQKQFKK